MDCCRICLKHCKNYVNIWDTYDSISYGQIITCITNAKILENEDKTTKICVPCKKKLIETYTFKLLIESSDRQLRDSANSKIIHFNNLKDIKIKIEVDIDTTTGLPISEDATTYYFKDGNDEIVYKNTLIKKVKIENKQKVALSVKEFLKSIDVNSEQSEKSGEDFVDNYDSLNDQDYKPHNNKKLVARSKQKPIGRPSKLPKDVIKIKPLKPKILSNIRMEKPKHRRRKEDHQIHQKRKDICPFCGKATFTLSSHLKIHTDERKFKCTVCSKTFFREAELARHVVLHDVPKQYKCNHCTAAFIGKEGLYSHMRSHSNEKKHVCPTCNKAFKRSCGLQRHALTHSSSNRTMNCELCSMSFYCREGLRHHMRTHTGERPYNCQLCSQPYSYKHDFNRHCFKKHGVFLKRRSVNVMNEEVLAKERVLMKELLLRVEGAVDDEPLANPFEGPQAAMAYEQIVKLLQARKIPIAFEF